MTYLFLDMDGVLADFDGAMRARGIHNEHHFIHLPRDQWTPAQAELDRRVRAEMEKLDFWLSIPVMAGAHDLVSAAVFTVGASNLFILTATPAITERRERIARHKVEWMQEHMGFPASRVITCLRSEKRRYAVDRAILVDDMEANCNDWRAAGGYAIQFTSASQAIRELNNIATLPGWEERIYGTV